MAEIALFPPVVSRRRWLQREGLKIAARVGTSSLANVRRLVESDCRAAGATAAETEHAVADAVALVEDVRDAALLMTGRAPSAPRPSGRAG